MNKFCSSILAALIVAVLVLPCTAGEPVSPLPATRPPSQRTVGWRYDGTGSFPNTNPPTEWSAAGLNTRWKVKFDDNAWSNAQPVVVGNRVIVVCEPTSAACLDADTGAILWRKDLGLLRMLGAAEADKLWPMWEERQRMAVNLNRDDAAAMARLKELDAILTPKTHLFGDGCQERYLKGYTFAAPVSDGALVYVKNLSGSLAAVDLDGNVKWLRDIGYNGEHGSVASPCLVDGRLIVWNLEREKSKNYVLSCFDAVTGKPLWVTEARPPGPGAGCASPVVLRLNDVALILTACGDIVRASDGKILAKEVHPQGFSTPPFHGNTVYFGVNGVVEAVRLTLDGEAVTATSLWKAKPTVDGGASGMYGGQVCHDGYVYMIQSRGQYSVMDAATGEVKCAKMLNPGKWARGYPNLSVAGGRIYAFDLNGQGVVLKAGPEGEVIACNQALGGSTTGPYFVGGRIYFRNGCRKWMPSWVYCLEEGGK